MYDVFLHKIVTVDNNVSKNEGGSETNKRSYKKAHGYKLRQSNIRLDYKARGHASRDFVPEEGTILSVRQDSLMYP